METNKMNIEQIYLQEIENLILVFDTIPVDTASK